ncbi:MAG TPA: hypothetical protein PKY51_12295 [Fimbriimonadaceae bacterium]|nr:hypothetical protein [Fimbriimonadaceae bacterium]
MIFPLEIAQRLNLAFLAIVALWRVALAIHYFRVGCGITITRSFVALLTPISIIILARVSSGRAGYVMDLMGGVRKATSTVRDSSDSVIAALAFLSVPIAFIGILSYVTVLASNVKSND